jgi:hypothetical protein
MKIVEISKKELIADYERISAQDICRKYGICRARLYRILDDLQVPRHIIRKSPTIVKVIVKE